MFLHATSAQLHPASSQLRRAAVQLHPASSQLRPAPSQLRPAPIQLRPASHQSFANSVGVARQCCCAPYRQVTSHTVRSERFTGLGIAAWLLPASLLEVGRGRRRPASLLDVEHGRGRRRPASLLEVEHGRGRRRTQRLRLEGFLSTRSGAKRVLVLRVDRRCQVLVLTLVCLKVPSDGEGEGVDVCVSFMCPRQMRGSWRRDAWRTIRGCRA
eukprot:207662-Chlamydomonas_euryale.AAC.1